MSGYRLDREQRKRSIALEAEMLIGELGEFADELISLRDQIAQLGDFIMRNIPGEPSGGPRAEGEGACECAIRLLSTGTGSYPPPVLHNVNAGQQNMVAPMCIQPSTNKSE